MKENEEFLVDTNILVYAYDTSEGEKHTKAKEIVEKVWKKGGGAITIQNLAEFVFVVTRKVKNPIPISEAKKITEGIINSAKWRILDRNIDTFLKGIELYEGSQIPFWDAQIVSVLLDNGIKKIITEDTDLEKIPELQVINPFKGDEN
ncbi:MAG TPA: PIN domain-containing protein [Geobacterales bacterium]|nr:PIN domain-containing protein [Geobacterales bacterium]